MSDSDERSRMDGEQPVAVLEELLAAKGEHLLRTAVLLAGSHDEGEDLLQAALERVFRRWRTIRGDPEGYLRRTLYHLAADGWRRKGAWRAPRRTGSPSSRRGCGAAITASRAASGSTASTRSSWPGG